jgi:hypothetical protein
MTKRSQVAHSTREHGRGTITGMPRAKNSTTGPEAEALDAAALARDEAEKHASEARLNVVKAMIAAIDAKMSVAEAARRAGYTREHASKLYATAKRPAEEQSAKRQTGRPRKPTE